MLHSLDHVILAVDDLDAGSVAYTRLLGRRPTWRGEHPALGTTNALFRVDNTYLELLAPAPDAGQWLRDRIADRGEGILGLAFGTEDAKACAAALERAGLHPGEPQAGLGRDVESGAFREWTNVHLPSDDTRGLMLFAIEHRSPPDALAPSPPIDEAAATAYALDHVVVQTPAPEAARELYEDRLGIRLALDRDAPQWGGRMLFFRIGGVTLEVVGREADADADARHDRLWGMAWRVRDAEAAHARLAAAGFELDALRDGRKPGTRVFTVKDGTCGVPTLVLQPPAEAD